MHLRVGNSCRPFTFQVYIKCTSSTLTATSLNRHITAFGKNSQTFRDVFEITARVKIVLIVGSQRNFSFLGVSITFKSQFLKFILNVLTPVRVLS